MVAFTYEIIDYEPNSEGMTLKVITDDINVTKKEELMTISLRGHEGAYSSDAIHHIILYTIGATLWPKWKKESNPAATRVEIVSLIGTVQKVYYDYVNPPEL